MAGDVRQRPGHRRRHGDASFSFTPYDNGIYTIRLFITDDERGLVAYPDEIVVTALNVAPELEAGDDREIGEGAAMQISVPFSDAGTNDTHSALIEWGDGSRHQSASLTETSGAGTIVASHAYADNGTYTVTVTLTDDDRASTADGFKVAVSERRAGRRRRRRPHRRTRARWCSSRRARLRSVTFSDAGSADLHTATIDWGDGTGTKAMPTASSSSAAMSYADNGEYTVTITVSDDDRDVGSDSFLLTVLNVAPVIRRPPRRAASKASHRADNVAVFDAGTPTRTPARQLGRRHRDRGPRHQQPAAGRQPRLRRRRRLHRYFTLDDDDGGERPRRSP